MINNIVVRHGHILRPPPFDNTKSLLADFFRPFDELPRLPTSLTDDYSAANIFEVHTDHESSFVFELPAPGFEPQDIAVDTSDSMLDIRGQRSIPEDSTRNHLARHNVTTFRERFNLPEDADSDNIRCVRQRHTDGYGADEA